MTVLVFGGSSQIGHYLLPLLAARGESVVAVSRAARSPSPGIAWLPGQLPSQVPALAGVSAVFSFGPLQPFADWLRDVELPHAPRVIATSSMSAETKRDSEVPAERAISQQLRDGENALASACAQHGSDWTVLRPTLVYGAGLDKSLTPIARRAMRTRVFPLPAGRGMRQPVHAQDLALAALAALDTSTAASKILSIGGGERLSAGEMFARVRRSLPVDTLPIPIPAWCLRLARRGVGRLRGPLSRLEADLIADNAEVMQLLGVNPRPFRPDVECWQPHPLG
ncbi:SDR family oxidoreductase [Dyella mobilis]|uniref:NAD-dependent epimerase/dehydratase family protein n=1 Tax=Dyella mobilis TaxID=1849582 RepID=A0ABS2KM04_9GAMM|nr:NAD-dependent epimerase/dehydratase family protein [Dyella mobilis]MBM7132187.1 NAD-dependent epimerase/dehydratase family protein [Dyella mobilis]GLQ95828.1 nucleoside-diphosphate sugar epimerase [Dyella mobilis]